MKYLLVSDLHYSLRQLDWLQKRGRSLRGRRRGRGSSRHLLGRRARGADRRRSSSTCSGYARARSWSSARATTISTRRTTRARRSRRGCRACGSSAWRRTATRSRSATRSSPSVRGGTARHARRRSTRSSRATRAARAGRRWVWVYHSPPAQSPTSWTGTQALRRRRPGANGSRGTTPDVVLTGPRPSVALSPGWIVGRSHRRHVGVQRRTGDGVRSPATS